MYKERVKKISQPCPSVRLSIFHCKLLIIQSVWAAILLKIGNGNIPVDQDGRMDLLHALPKEQIVDNSDELIWRVFADIENNFKDKSWLYLRQMVFTYLIKYNEHGHRHNLGCGTMC